MEETIPCNLQISAVLSRAAVAPGEDESEPVGALLSIWCGEGRARSGPLELCLVLDASGSMHRFHLDAEQRTLWRRIAEARGDLVCESADGQEGWLWSGETLREMRGLIQTPMMAVVRALGAMARRLEPEDRLTVIAFADEAEVLLNRAREAERAEGLRGVVSRLTRGVDDSGLGRGSRLAEALCLARRVTPNDPERPCRILIVSDGVVEDRTACLREAEEAADEGTLVSTIGVGDEFDEELLMRIADDARGCYTYAPTAAHVEAALNDEIEALARLAARRLTITIRPDRDVVFRELFQVAPAVSRFNTMWMEGGGYRYQLGDLARGETVQLLAEFVLPPTSSGPLRLGEVLVRAEGDRAAIPLEVTVADDAVRVWERDAEVIGVMEAIAVYLSERRAQEAASRADYEEATRQLRHTTRILQRMGRSALAADFEAAATDLEAGRTVSLSRTKKLKAATRRLEPLVAPSPAAAHAAPGHRDLVHGRGG